MSKKILSPKKVTRNNRVKSKKSKIRLNTKTKEAPAPVKKKRRAKTPTKMYFTQDTEDAIVAYNNEENSEIREKIYREKIEYPFQKLIENIFNRFGFAYFRTSPAEVQREALSHLVANLGKYDPNRLSKKKGKKKKSAAFSYFSVIAKNWFILLNNTTYTEFQSQVGISDEREEKENTVQLQHQDKYHTQIEMDEFLNLTITFWENNVERIFNKQRDLNIANAVIELLRNAQRIEAFNKKSLYLGIREMSDCKTQQITKVINKMKQYQRNNHKMYLNEGIVSNTLHL